MTEKKLKIASENIRMSDELKERIMKKCESSAENINNDGYTDHVYQVETVKPRKWLKIISEIAACAVIAGGVSTGVVYMSRHGAPSAELEDVETTQEVSDTVEETSQKRLVIDDIMDYRYTNITDGEFWTDEQLMVLDNLLKCTELIETEYAPDSTATRLVYSNKKCEVQILNTGIVLYIDENDNVTCYSVDTDAIHKMANIEKDVNIISEFENIEKCTNAFNEFVNDNNFKMYYYCNLADMFTPEMILNGEEPQIGFSKPVEFNDAMQYALCDYMSRQAMVLPPNMQTTNLFIEIKDADNIHVASVSIFDEGCMSFEILEDGVSVQQYWMTCDITDIGKILTETMNTEENHGTNAAYFFPGGNFVKMGRAEYEMFGDEKHILTDEQSEQIQDILYGYDWKSHEVQWTEDIEESMQSELCAPFSFRFANVNDKDRVINIGKGGYVYYFDRIGTDGEISDFHVYYIPDADFEIEISEVIYRQHRTKHD